MLSKQSLKRKEERPKSNHEKKKKKTKENLVNNDQGILNICNLTEEIAVNRIKQDI